MIEGKSGAAGGRKSLIYFQEVEQKTLMRNLSFDIM